MESHATSSRRLLPPLYPGSPTATCLTRAGNSHHQSFSRRRPFQHNPAATAHFATQASSSSYHQPPSLLSRTTHASAGVGGSSNAISQITLFGSACAAGSSSHQAPPPLLSQIHSSGRVIGGVVDGARFAYDASQVALPGSSSYDMPPPSSLAPMPLDPVPMLGDEDATLFSLSEADLASIDFGLTTEEYSLTAASIDFDPVQYMDLQGSGGHHLNSSASDRGSTSTNIPCPPLPQPYSSGYTQASSTPLPLTPSSSMHTPVANFVVKKEPDNCSWETSQRGKNKITIGGSSSSSMPHPHSSGSKGKDIMVFKSKREQLPAAPLVAYFADGQFTQDDIDKIMAKKELADIVLEDPKRVRITLRNRTAAERSRQRRIARLSFLEREVPRLQQENRSLSARVHSVQSTHIGLTTENNEIKMKLEIFQQEMQLKSNLNKALRAELHHLKLIAGEIMTSHVSSSSYQERSLQMMHPELSEKHSHQLAQLQRNQELRDLENFFRQ